MTSSPYADLRLPSLVRLNVVSSLTAHFVASLLHSIGHLLTFSALVWSFRGAGALGYVAEQDDDDSTAMRAVAETRERRQKRQQQLNDQRRRPAASLTSTTIASVRRPLQSATIGSGDYDTADASEDPQQQEGGEYSAERLAALRLNAIHIGPAHLPSPPPAHVEAVVDDDNGTLTEREERMVRAAKAQRARQRAITDLGEDYIPITSTAQHKPSSIVDDGVIRIDGDDTDEQPVPVAARLGRTYLTAEDEDESRHGTLMREEDDDDVVDMTMEAREVKEQDRLLFGDDGKQKRRERTRQEIKDTLKSTARDEVEVEDVDSDMEEWEVEQLRNGGVRVVEKTTASQPSTSKARATDRDAASSSLQLSLASLSLSSLRALLQSSLSTLHHTNAATQSSLSSLATRLSSSRSQLTTLSSSLETLNERYQFYQQERDWVTVWSGMMAEKIADIDEAWQEMTNMRRKQGAERQSRMRQYRRDEREETGLLAEVAGEGVVELDEFGRDLGYVREMDRERRDDIRSAVRKLSPQRRNLADSVLTGQLDGWATEDETYDEVEGVAAVQEAARVSFVEDVRGIMADVDDEWRSADRVIAHFQHWRRRDLQSYHDAYVSLTLPKVLAPYVRMDLMLHNALHSQRDVKRHHLQPLSNTVLLLAQPLLQPGSEERSVAEQLVAEVVVPWLCEIVRWEWNVYSVRHTRSLHLTLTTLARAFTPSDEQPVTEQYNRQWQQLHDAVRERLRVEVDEWQPLRTASNEKVNERQLRAIVRVCARGVKLLDLLDDWLSPLPTRAAIVSVAQAIANVEERQQSNVAADLSVLSQQLVMRGEQATVVKTIERHLRSGTADGIAAAWTQVEALLKKANNAE